MDVLTQLKTSLAENLDRSFSRAYRGLSAELAVRDARIEETERKAKLANQAQETAFSRIKDLEQQLSFLRGELSRQESEWDDHDAYLNKSRELREAYDPERVFHAVDIDGLDTPHNLLLQAYKDVESKYRSLYEECQTLVKVFGTLRTQVKRAREKVALWQEYFTRDQFTVPVDGGATVTFKRVDGAAERNQRNQTSSRRLEPAGSPIKTSLSDINQPGSESPIQRPGSPSLLPQNAVRSSPRPKFEASDTDRVNLSAIPLADPASTQSEGSDGAAHALSSHDESFCHPTMVAAKSLKRRRQPAREYSLPASSCHRLEDESSPRPASIKSEHTSPSPLQNRDLNPPGTQDLDDVGNTVKTPRKQARRNVKTPVFEDSDLAPDLDNCCPQAQAEQEKSTPPTALKPVDSNRKTNPRSDGDYDAKRRKISGRGEQSIPAVAEDGDESYLDPQTGRHLNKPRRTFEPERSSSIGTVLSTHRRLKNLLEVPSPSKSALTPRKTPKTCGVSLQEWLGSCDSLRYTGPSLRRNPESPNGIRKQVTSTRWDRESRIPENPSTLNEPQPDGFNGGCPEIRLEDGPYRSWPVHRLDLSCFKINPERNQGMDFAFDEVVRKKDQRKFLSGCTRPDCCGDRFRAMVRAGDLIASSSGSEDGDLQILEEFLGDQKDRLNTMSDKERQELLIDAKARLLANQYGKHRYTHERARSPPGFWRADMPDTQELEQDREAARQLEREKVMERYREAMRPGGLWKFADE